VDGPWSRYVDCGDTSPLSPTRHVASNPSADMSAHSKIGLARYPRLEPRAAEEAKAAKVKQPKAPREKHADEMI
jgi:hypothetical protein